MYALANALKLRKELTMHKSVLQIDLSSRQFTFKSIDGVLEYIGGETLANFLLKNYLEKNESRAGNYFSITSGPLNGLFPYTSKAVTTHLYNNTKINYIGGGNVGALINLANLYSIEVVGKSTTPLYLEVRKGSVKFLDASKDFLISSLGLSGRRFIMEFDDDIKVSGVFSYGKNLSKENNLLGLVFSFDGEYKIPDMDDYDDVLEKIKNREKELSVSRSMNYSCFGCPMACDFSTSLDTNKTSTLTKSLVGCGFADSIYTDINLVFLCFQSLRYSYNHEFLEFFPHKAGVLNKSLDELLLKLN